ncbi:MAG: 16S rRNA (uracil(1498)-N(3))-methyltransferase [Spirochaetales bacterium]|nr:16S rRNA (uracil(1498)-N(3))-methyltransferase [Spirochaetales bacterium]
MNIILFEDEQIPEKISIKDEKAKHILKILKLKTGDKFSCGLVNGPSGTGSITIMDKDWIYFSWEKTTDSVPLYPLTLLIGYTRPISSKRILREAASLGVEKIIFTGTDTGEKSYRDSNLWKGEYRGFLMAGAQQAASTGVPVVEFYKDLQTFIRENPYKHSSSALERIVLDNVEPKVKLAEYNPGDSNCLLAIGSERGWSERERNIFKINKFIFASLGNRVLRTETASTAGISMMLARMGLI